MSKKNNNKLSRHPKIRKQTEKFANEIANILVLQFEKAKQEADKNGGNFNFDMNGELKKVLEEKGKEMSNFVKDTLDKEKRKYLQQQEFKKHTVKVSIR
jgi:hypothetical protein